MSDIPKFVERSWAEEWKRWPKVEGLPCAIEILLRELSALEPELQHFLETLKALNFADILVVKPEPEPECPHYPSQPSQQLGLMLNERAPVVRLLKLRLKSLKGTIEAAKEKVAELQKRRVAENGSALKMM